MRTQNSQPQPCTPKEGINTSETCAGKNVLRMLCIVMVLTHNSHDLKQGPSCNSNWNSRKRLSSRPAWHKQVQYSVPISLSLSGYPIIYSYTNTKAYLVAPNLQTNFVLIPQLYIPQLWIPISSQYTKKICLTFCVFLIFPVYPGTPDKRPPSWETTPL